MTLNAFKDGVTVINQDNMNQLLSLQDFFLIYEGIQRDAKTGSGVTENNIANYSYCARFQLWESTTIGRVELHLDKDGAGADLVVQIRSGMTPSSGADGALLKEVVVPKEFIPTTAAYCSIPIGLSGLTPDLAYFLTVTRAGDASNKVDWIGEAAQDGSYPAYRRAGTSGAWTANNALHFRVLSGESGELVHSIYAGTGYTTILYSNETVSKVYRYLPPADGSAGGIRDVITYTWAGEYLKQGAVS
jgi:hypothetical protein